MRRYVRGKIHRVGVTDKSLSYHGSVSCCRKLLRESGIEEFECVEIANQQSGVRWVTYVIGNDEEGAFTLNGGGARLGELGDELVVVAFSWNNKFPGANVVVCDSKNKNKIVDRLQYIQKEPKLE